MQLIRCLLSNFYLNMFRASLCPSSGEQDRILLHMVFCTGCAGCGCVELGRKLCAPHNHSHHNQCRTPYAVIHGLVLLMMDIMMPETCWDRSLIINVGLVAFCWFISLRPSLHDARSQEPKTYLFLFNEASKSISKKALYWDRFYRLFISILILIRMC